MNYRLTCLSPLLVGDGSRLSPIDYMVWKDHVNILDQRRIFQLLAKGPRLDGYLSQLKKAEKLDFASWGGFAQNFAGRRIPFEHSSSSQFWERAQTESLHIPTFASGISGPYLPGSALKGALRTAMLFSVVKPGALNTVAGKLKGERIPRRPAEEVEHQVMGPSGRDRMRAVMAGDSKPIATSNLKVFLLRLSTLLPSREPNKYSLGWKVSPRGAVDSNRVGDSTPTFAEMAVPGSTFEGAWKERSANDRARIFDAGNKYTAQLIQLQRTYAEAAGLGPLKSHLDNISERLGQIDNKRACIISLGWGGGLLTKTSWIEKDVEEYKDILKQLPYYSRAASSGLPFPKTRRIVFEQNQPASMPGWAILEVVD